MRRGVWLLGLTVAAWSVRAGEPVTFARYQVIVEKSPFGATAGAGAVAPVPNFAEQFTFVGVVPDPLSAKVLAIIQDRERVYLRGEGETIGDVRVRQIQAAGGASWIELVRGLEVATLKFKERTAGAVPMLPAGVTAAGPILRPMQPGQQPTTGKQPEEPPRRRIPFRRGDE